MDKKPIVKTFADDSKIWNHSFENFKAKVYVPVSDLPEKIINFGYEAPYLCIFTEKELNDDEAKAYADSNKFSLIASDHASSVVFIYPTCDGGWKNAGEELYTELIANTKIHEFHEDGMAVLINRFTKGCDGYAIRGAIFRAFLFGKGDAADYIGRTLLKTVNGQGLWGPADVAPTAVILENLSANPLVERKDMPIVSIGNSIEINEYIMEAVDECYILPTADYKTVYDEFLKDFIRWGWVGTLMDSPDFEKLSVKRDFGIANITTSPDNSGYDKGTKSHDIGYIAFYNKDLFKAGPAPLLLCFHGGGDSAMHIAEVSEWYKVAKDHNFLLVCIENHLNSTATEMMELLEILYKKYDIDKTRIYGSGFSMGGCKSWDLYQEYPKVFAGLAPMDATFEVGLNVFGEKVTKEINRNDLVPIFYTGGEETPLPELPFQADKCFERMEYVFKVNNIKKPITVTFDNKDAWENKIWGINGDRTEKIYDPSRDATLTVEYFDSADGNCYTAFGSVSGQGHECRYHTCEQEWLFLSKFRRMEDGSLIIEK